MHDFRAEIIGLGEQLLVGRRQAVGLVRRFAFGEAVFSLPVVLDVAPGALDEMPRKFNALRLRKG